MTMAHNAHDLRHALTRIPQQDRSALAHLALPLDQVVGVHATVDASSFSWRGFCLPWSSGDAAEVVAAVVTAGALAQDSWLDLQGPVEDWVKVVRSGSRKVAFGVPELFAGPSVQMNVDVPDDAVRSWMKVWLGSGRATGPVASQGKLWWAYADHGRVTIAASSAASGLSVLPADPADVASAAAVLAGRSGRELVSVTPATDTWPFTHGARVQFADQGPGLDILVSGNLEQVRLAP